MQLYNQKANIQAFTEAVPTKTVFFSQESCWSTRYKLLHCLTPQFVYLFDVSYWARLHQMFQNHCRWNPELAISNLHRYKENRRPLYEISIECHTNVKQSTTSHLVYELSLLLLHLFVFAGEKCFTNFNRRLSMIGRASFTSVNDLLTELWFSLKCLSEVWTWFNSSSARENIKATLVVLT